MKKLLGFLIWLCAYVPISTFIYLALFNERKEIFPKGYWYYAKRDFKHFV